MKTTVWCSTIIVVLGALGILLARAGTSSPPDPSLELREQVKALKEQVAALESRLAQVESAQQRAAPKVQILPQPPGQPPLYFPPSRPGQQPRVDGQLEANGWTFYLIPCEGR